MYWEGFNWCAKMLTSKQLTPVSVKAHIEASVKLTGELDDYNSGVREALQGFISMTDSLQVG